MTRRTCWTCEHFLRYRIYKLLGEKSFFEAMECDFEGVTVPCNESEICGRWSAREEKEEEEDVD